MTDEHLGERLDRIENLLATLVEREKVKDWCSVEEVATRMGKAAFTVREQCRHGRILAQKRPFNRGKSAEWMISHEELVRVQNQGLLPVDAARRYRLDTGVQCNNS